MHTLPLSYDTRRPTRVHFAEKTPAVLRVHDGACTPAELQVLSMTGGLLGLSQQLRQGCVVKLMFLTPSGAVQSAAEMLTPLTRSQQPFRFVSLHEDDQRRLQSTIQSSLCKVSQEQEWIEKYRAAMSQIEPPRRSFLKVVLGTLAMGLILLGSTLYLLHGGLLHGSLLK